VGWETSDRREHLPADWPKRRTRQLRLDGYRCTERLEDGARCEREAEEVDHVNGRYDEDTLTSLCSWHHGKKTAKEGQAAQRKNMAAQNRKFRRGESHPGTLRR